VLAIDEEPIVAGVGELLRDGRAVAIDEDTELGLACTKISLELSPRIGKLYTATQSHASARIIINSS
jgi:hypothetical protein